MARVSPQFLGSDISAGSIVATYHPKSVIDAKEVLDISAGSVSTTYYPKTVIDGSMVAVRGSMSSTYSPITAAATQGSVSATYSPISVAQTQGSTSATYSPITVAQTQGSTAATYAPISTIPAGLTIYGSIIGSLVGQPTMLTTYGTLSGMVGTITTSTEKAALLSYDVEAYGGATEVGSFCMKINGSIITQTVRQMNFPSYMFRHVFATCFITLPVGSNEIAVQGKCNGTTPVITHGLLTAVYW